MEGVENRLVLESEGVENKLVLESEGAVNKLVLESEGIENTLVLESDGVENKPVLESPSERDIEGRVKLPVEGKFDESFGMLAVELFRPLLVDEGGFGPVIDPFLEPVALEL